jgi:hypothetical protein
MVRVKDESAFGRDLRAKALFALEEVVHDCRYSACNDTYSVRFALAYLYHLAPTDPEPFRTFWRKITSDNSLFRYSEADEALRRIYAHLGEPRQSDEALRRFWRSAQARKEARAKEAKLRGYY